MRSLPGVYGGRFSGAGFKGACIALVDPAHKAEIEKVLTERYLEQFPEYERTFQVFWVKPDDGANAPSKSSGSSPMMEPVLFNQEFEN